MSDEETKQIEPYYGKYPKMKELGFSRDDAKTLAKWIDEGKPGLAKSKAETMGQIYLMGYSCKEIHKWFPEYPLELLLYARYQYDWDLLRHEYNNRVMTDIVQSAVNSRKDSIQLISDIMTATHTKWRKELMEYLTDPEGNKPPEFLPKNLDQYGKISSLLQSLVEPPVRQKPGPQGHASKDGTPTTPLVSVTVKNGNEKDVVITDSAQEQIKKRLLEETGMEDNE